MFATDYTITLDPALTAALIGLLTAAAGWIRSHITVKKADATIQRVNGDITTLRAELGVVTAKVDAAAQRAAEGADKVAATAATVTAGLDKVLAVGQGNAETLAGMATAPPALPVPIPVTIAATEPVPVHEVGGP